MSPTVRQTAKWLALQKRTAKLSRGDRLRVAAVCIDDGEYEIAETLAGNVVDELRALRVSKAHRVAP